MLRRPLACLALLFMACDSQVETGEAEPPRLLDASFHLDVVGNPGFTPKPALWSGDTLTLYDYWALLEQPKLRARATWTEDRLSLGYEAASTTANDWSPSVETRLRILVPSGRRGVDIRFLAMPRARKPYASEDSLGVQDATRERVMSVRRP